MREPLLEAFAPTAVLLGHAQEAIDALNEYAATTSKPGLLIERGRAYQAAHQLARAAKDYQTIFYTSPPRAGAPPRRLCSIASDARSREGVSLSRRGNAGAARAGLLRRAQVERSARGI